MSKRKELQSEKKNRLKGNKEGRSRGKEEGRKGKRKKKKGWRREGGTETRQPKRAPLCPKLNNLSNDNKK